MVRIVSAVHGAGQNRPMTLLLQHLVTVLGRVNGPLSVAGRNAAGALMAVMLALGIRMFTNLGRIRGRIVMLRMQVRQARSSAAPE